MHLILCQRLEVLGIEDTLAVGSVETLDAVGIGLLNLATNNLHGAVHHTILLGESLRQHGEGAGEPTIGEELSQVATLLEASDVSIDELNACLAALLSSEVKALLLESSADILLIGYEQCDGLR